MMCLGRHPDLFACGISQAGTSDWNLAHTRQNDFQKNVWSHRIGLSETAPNFEDALAKLSPLNYVKSYAAPLLLIQGTEDDCVYPDQSRNMHYEMLGHGKISSLILASGDKHKYLSFENQLLNRALTLSFVACHLQLPLNFDVSIYDIVGHTLHLSSNDDLFMSQSQELRTFHKITNS